jgi:hypothetical protein
MGGQQALCLARVDYLHDEGTLLYIFEGIIPLMYTRHYFLRCLHPPMYSKTFDTYICVFTSFMSYGSHFLQCMYMCMYVLLFMCVQYVNILFDLIAYLSFDLVS